MRRAASLHPDQSGTRRVNGRPGWDEISVSYDLFPIFLIERNYKQLIDTVIVHIYDLKT
jgi:hypothetical protein